MQHMLPSETTSTPIVHVHPLTSSHTDTDSHGDRLSLKTALDGITTVALTSCLTAVSDTKTFYSAVEVTDHTTTTTTTMEDNSGETPPRRRRAPSSVRSTEKPPSRRQSVTRSSTFSPSSTS